MVVVIDHSLMTSPALSHVKAGARPGTVHGWAWWVSYTPLHLLWAGPEAVYVFFVLSGFVLVLPLSSPRFSWAAYYPRRLARLYLPVIASLLFALATLGVVMRRDISGASSWLNSNHIDGSVGMFLHDVVLVKGVSLLNSPLWSLKWEVIFSLFLPAYVLGARIAPRAGWLKAALLLAIVVWAAHVTAATALPLFGLGVLLAFHREALSALAARIPGTLWIAIGVFALVALTAAWTGQGALDQRVQQPLLIGLEVLGAATMVFVFAFWRVAQRVGEAAPVRWLGVRSFSIYLVHLPIVVSCALLLGGRANALVTLAIALPASLVVADLFYRAIEGPSHRASQAIGRFVQFRASPEPAQQAAVL